MYAQMTNMAMCADTCDRERQGRLHLHRRALNRGQLGLLWSKLTGRSTRLYSLKSIETDCVVHGRRSAGHQTVSIEQIRGSEGRAHDFDRDFNPLQSHTRERWLSIAAVLQRGKALPPVLLVQVGDIYFVKDGHHRVSVARALGQKAVEARVMVWQVAGPLPWETQTRVPGYELAGAEKVLGRLRRQGARRYAGTLLGIHQRLGAAGTS
jgi:hypothetical protein